MKDVGLMFVFKKFEWNKSKAGGINQNIRLFIGVLERFRCIDELLQVGCKGVGCVDRISDMGVVTIGLRMIDRKRKSIRT